MNTPPATANGGNTRAASPSASPGLAMTAPLRRCRGVGSRWYERINAFGSFRIRTGSSPPPTGVGPLRRVGFSCGRRDRVSPVDAFDQRRWPDVVGHGPSTLVLVDDEVDRVA